MMMKKIKSPAPIMDRAITSSSPVPSSGAGVLLTVLFVSPCVVVTPGNTELDVGNTGRVVLGEIVSFEDAGRTAIESVLKPWVEDRVCVGVEDRLFVRVEDGVCIGVEDGVCIAVEETSRLGVEGCSRVDDAIKLGLDGYKVDDDVDDDDSVNVDVNTMSDDSWGVGREETMDDGDTDDDDDDDVNEGTNGPKTRDWEEMDDGVTTEDTEYSLDK